jgi:hypothetical protein
MRLIAAGSQFVAAGTTVLASLVLLTGCKSKPSISEESKQPAPANTVAADHFDGGTYCVQKFLEGPPPAQPLHFSNQVVENDPARKTKDFQADLSGDNVDLVHRDKWLATDDDRKLFEESKRFDDPKFIVRNINNGIAEETVTNHATRSDGVSWRGVIVSVAQGGTPWNLFASKPTVNRVGTETVNGYDTIKYAVDTTHDSQTDKAALLMASQSLKDYNITGTAWVLKDANCVLQYNINFEETGKDGKVSKTHYEGTITKK